MLKRLAAVRWRRLLLEALLVFAVIVGVQLYQSRGLPEGAAPALEGNLANGSTTSLAEVLRQAGGKPVLVAFWATWCPVCKAEEGNLAAIARDTPFIGVAMQSGDAVAVARHLKDRGLDFSSIPDPAGVLAAQWRVRGVPTHFIVDGQGQVRFREVGYVTTLGLRARLWWAQRFPA